MIISNMEEKDWETFLAQPPLEDECVDVIQNELPLLAHELVWSHQATAMVPRELNESDHVYDYVRVIKESAKAKFFATEITAFHTHGFWCPKAAIEEDTGKQVIVANWCEITIIEWG